MALACSGVLGAGPAPSVAAASVLSPVSWPAFSGTLRSAGGSDLALLKSLLPPWVVGCVKLRVCLQEQSLCSPQPSGTPRGSPTGLEALHSGGSPSLAQDPSWGTPQPLAAWRRPPWLVALPRVGRPSCHLAVPASLSLAVADPSWPAPSQWSFWRALEGRAPGLLLHCPAHPLAVVTLEGPGGPCSRSPAPPSWPSPCGQLCVCLCGCSLGFGGCPSLPDVSLC